MDVSQDVDVLSPDSITEDQDGTETLLALLDEILASANEDGVDGLDDDHFPIVERARGISNALPPCGEDESPTEWANRLKADSAALDVQEAEGVEEDMFDMPDVGPMSSPKARPFSCD